MITSDTHQIQQTKSHRCDWPWWMEHNWWQSCGKIWEMMINHILPWKWWVSSITCLTLISSLFKKHIAALSLCNIGLAVVLACLCALIAINEWIIENVPHSRIFSLTSIQYDWFFKNLRHSRIFSLYRFNTIYFWCCQRYFFVLRFKRLAKKSSSLKIFSLHYNCIHSNSGNLPHWRIFSLYYNSK